ncbi:cytochrome P450 84A1-like [Neltuma alba]|uniref:cytochrome P450 84A1-like n=1 Tax=Neltuma alba TaxID=207710 RepID=UPI0010A3C864|nr:cytochrome P450 84A1-like [Prosopis alba]
MASGQFSGSQQGDAASSLRICSPHRRWFSHARCLPLSTRNEWEEVNPDAARQVLQVHDNIFSNRPATIAISYLTYDRADMAFAHYSPFWRQMRKLCVMKLFSHKRGELWQSVRDEMDAVVRTVASNTGKPVNIGELNGSSMRATEMNGREEAFRVEWPNRES